VRRLLGGTCRVHVHQPVRAVSASALEFSGIHLRNAEPMLEP
jgi:hypothetical protein